MTFRKAVAAKRMCDELVKRGIIPERVTRATIRFQVGEPVYIDCTIIADERLLEPDLLDMLADAAEVTVHDHG